MSLEGGVVAAGTNSTSGEAIASEMQMRNQALSATSDVRKSEDDNNGNSSNLSAANIVTGELKITFLMVTTEKCIRTFVPDDTVLHAKEALINDWPDNFGSKPPTSLNLRILYMGHFLDDSATLRDSKLNPGETTVHLMIKASSTHEKEAKKDIDKAPKCTCIIL
ncbi:hypothetical protein H4R27_000971 [Coemansia aciculifera]|uniref:Ubiquitin-like domain-containing protein n=1 Tax=Coemansia pectinata TaxID=1052879 RepID=A0A9W8LCV8_9FUNG|nr:hypothetical protein GGI19_001388 [Coemansia pectinata]KAJ2885995.1 hypothetical protein H4R27_000971 [Coemansia aciculifera]